VWLAAHTRGVVISGNIRRATACEAGGAGDERASSRMWKWWHERHRCIRAYTQQALRAYLPIRPILHASPLERSQTPRHAPNRQGRGVPRGVVLREESIEAAVPVCTVVSWVLLFLWQGACHDYPPLLAGCLLFPHGRLSLTHARSHVLLTCRQFSSRAWWWSEHDYP